MGNLVPFVQFKKRQKRPWSSVAFSMKWVKHGKYQIVNFCFFSSLNLYKLFLDVSQNSQENTCSRVSFLITLQALTLDLEKVVFKSCQTWTNYNLIKSFQLVLETFTEWLSTLSFLNCGRWMIWYNKWY